MSETAGWERRGGAAVYALWAMALVVFVLTGCGPPGPRAVLKGERLIREGKYDAAVAQLQEAIRLIPTNAQAWNHLGLALHNNKQPKDALKAYRQALALDRKLSVVPYNVGCLLLEQNDPAAAIEPLTSYTYLQPRSPAGWLKLGTAQLRARKFDAAEASFRRVLDIEPRNIEAMNSLGVAQANRKRSFEALASFNQALRQDARYAPALLNAAVVTYQLNSSGVALQKLRQYVALEPPPPQRAAVVSFANRIEQEANPPKPLSLPVTNSMAAAVVAPTNRPVRSEVAAAAVSNTPPRTNAPAPAPAPAPVVVQSPPVITNPAPATNKSETVAALVHAVPRKATEVEVTKLSDDLVVTPARDMTAPPARAESQPARTTPAPPAPEKKPFLTRLNPFANKPGSPETRSDPPARSGEGSRLAAAQPAQPPDPAVPRYAFTNPRPGGVGNRSEASRALTEGLKAHQAGRLPQALISYERAVQSDPNFFEAQYNFGLALYESGNVRSALAVFENALALRPDSADARYNFALALKQGSYLYDAADQLERILRGNPDDTRAHLSLGNLYSQKLNRPNLAREHYERVLAKEPRHPQAAQIRLWMAANANAKG